MTTAPGVFPIWAQLHAVAAALAAASLVVALATAPSASAEVAAFSDVSAMLQVPAAVFFFHVTHGEQPQSFAVPVFLSENRK
eukprot:CAMPEP_0172921220 /NCGR_PEP_ID=MMETSP1075-20121228/205510_1 /TAXON_ID=2916 /ORGANISM="Ceratium fusus, Strain PA161109" /LENGTH=81 /DNA_ID=CAMNT_0013781357 /DNA_START=211 /DNA_END=453 /DNA_ORIENTATION=-